MADREDGTPSAAFDRWNMEQADPDDPMEGQDWHLALDNLLGMPNDGPIGPSVDSGFYDNMDMDQQPGSSVRIANTMPDADLDLPDLFESTESGAVVLKQPTTASGHESTGSDSDLDPVTTDHNGLTPRNNRNQEQMDSDEVEDLEMGEDLIYDGAGFSNDSTPQIPEALSSRLFPIEIVLNGPSDAESYKVLPPSETVDRILDEVDIEGETFFSVEFTDGRIEQKVTSTVIMVAYDDLLRLDRGPQAVETFYEDPRFNLRTMPANYKKPLPEEEYQDSEDSEPEFPFYPQRQTRPSFRNSRNASRQISASTRPRRATNSGSVPVDDRDELNAESLLDSTTKNDDGDELSSAGRSGTRMTRSRKPQLQNYNLEDSADELSQIINDTEEDGEDWLLTSDINPKPKRKKRSALRQRKSMLRQPPKAGRNRESSIEFEPSRRSRRAAKTAKSMRDPEVDDDFFFVAEKGPVVPKIAAVKEVFRTVPADDPFRAIHLTICETCQGPENNGRGMFVASGLRAQRDHRVTKVDEDEFVLQCKFCIGIYGKKDQRAPDHALCQACRKAGKACREFSPKKTPKQEEKLREQNDGKDPITEVTPDRLNNPDIVLSRCTICRRAYHQNHLPTEHSSSGAKSNAHKSDWRCSDCVGTHTKIQSLVAWRPAPGASYKPGQQHLDLVEQDIEYLVKYAERSHFHDEWMAGAWVFGVAASGTRNAFYKRETSALPQIDLKSAVAEEWILPDIIFEVQYRHSYKARSKAEERGFINDIESVRVKYQGLSYEETVWDAPPPRDSVWGQAPWEAFEDAFAEYLNGKHFAHIPESKLRERIAMYRRLDFLRECELKKQPGFLKRGKLMEYQLEGVNWLLYKFHQNKNAILADEMGLGKTVQIVAFLATMALHQPKCWPFLVVVPNATCPNWRREIKKWAPDLRVVAYHGGKAAQDLAWEYELFPNGKSDGMRAHVVIMSFEAATNMKAQFGSKQWGGLIVDEGQRLKNEDSLLYRALSEIRFPCRILLTGTPLQNNKRELFNLLQFIDPANDAQALDQKYAELNNENLPELHKLIKPYFLRRTKAQVLHFLPPMSQIILPVSMSLLQEKLCKSIMARNTELIQAIVSKRQIKSGERKSLNNILMDLRQCLCHPFCFNADVEDKTADAEQMHRNLVAASGKLMLLNIMLPKLRERGHRVLIFSQFLHSLTILEDFLTGLGVEHLRIDGSISALEKQRRIDAFNADDSSVFAMLLSTRAGGVGINLYTADTVIIYDPDFNPHQDIQALSRAHRIGQKNKVLCFQLTTKNTAEEKIMQVGRKKMALDHALIESMDTAEDAGGDLESILKHGAAALFGDSKAEDKIIYDAASIDKLLDRSKIEVTQTGPNETSTENQFSFARVWQNDKDELVDNDNTADSPEADVDAAIWEAILRERQEEHERELAVKRQEYGRGARRKTAAKVRYNKHRPDDGDELSDMDVDHDYDDANEEDAEDDSDTGTSGAPADEPRPLQAQRNQGVLATPAVKAKPPRAAARHSLSSSTAANPHLNGTLMLRPAPQNSAEAALSEILAQAHSTKYPQTFVPPPQSKQGYSSAQQNQQPAVPAATEKQPGRRGRPPKEKPAQKPKPKTFHERLMDQMGTDNVHIAFYLSMTRKRVCVVCGGQHPLATSCIDFNSELSLRYAIDMFRTYLHGNEYHNDLMKKFLRDRLLEVLDAQRRARQQGIPALDALAQNLMLAQREREARQAQQQS
ncbi:hypothetical protein Micbo1qcDRAFT_195696 [Microdochium bolleyi]|uniref:SNF2 family N-terminal domain-domain-containing protein n=1 Tax=Microdochium bolleyi TaxID=196109 RepID=A0A136J0W6_9PEZI|nr:hypothetical protein Micbo1qcDRAFT_195696 [Microdochium bolleyi]